MGGIYNFIIGPCVAITLFCSLAGASGNTTQAEESTGSNVTPTADTDGLTPSVEPSTEIVTFVTNSEMEDKLDDHLFYDVETWIMRIGRPFLLFFGLVTNSLTLFVLLRECS